MDAGQVTDAAGQLTARLGLRVTGEVSEKRNRSLFRLTGFPRPYGFEVEVEQGLALISARLNVDRLAMPLLDLMSIDVDQKWPRFVASCESFSSAGIRIRASVNHGGLTDFPASGISDLKLEARAVDWKRSMADTGLDVATAVLSLVCLLIESDFEDSESEGARLLGEVEGQKYSLAVSRYERSRANRAMAITLHGVTCRVCGFNFGETYGPEGAGYVEIHHTASLHLLDAPRQIDVAEELVPLCANCHRVAHRVDPPYTPEQLKELLSDP